MYLDKGAELEALAKLPKDERKGLIVRTEAAERADAQRAKDSSRAAV
jgi:hypothetical protein